MATVNKSSLRAEFDALKARFESLCAEGKMSADSRALFDALLMLFEVLMAVFMEKHTPKGSANSSLPASQSPNDDTARTGPGAKGKGPSYNDARCANTRTRESARVLSVDACGRCGEDLTDAACLGHDERRTLIDIVFEKVVRHADAQIKHCPRCHAEARARFPHEMPGPLQYGPGIKAYVVHLLIAQMLSLKRVADAHNLWERLQNYETAVLRFAKHPMSPSPTIAPSATCAWPRSSRKSRGASAPASTPKPIAESQAICSPWPTRVTTRWWPFRSLSPGVPLIIWVSSYEP